jgi:hypothetical protein
MTLPHEETLAQITTPKPPRKGETGEHILADKRKCETTAALIAGVKKKAVVGGVRG